MPSGPRRGTATGERRRLLHGAPAAGRRRRRPTLLTVISRPHGAQQQIGRTPLLLSIDGTDRRTDREKLDRFTDPAQHTMRRTVSKTV